MDELPKKHIYLITESTYILNIWVSVNCLTKTLSLVGKESMNDSSSKMLTWSAPLTSVMLWRCKSLTMFDKWSCNTCRIQ